MTETLRALILSRQAGAVCHAAAYLLVAVSAAGLVLIFTGRPHLAPVAMLTALSSLAVFSLFTIAQHLATARESRRPWPHRDTAQAALCLSMFPITLLSSHLDDWTFRIAALPILISMV